MGGTRNGTHGGFSRSQGLEGFFTLAPSAICHETPVYWPSALNLIGDAAHSAVFLFHDATPRSDPLRLVGPAGGTSLRVFDVCFLPALQIAGLRLQTAQLRFGQGWGEPKRQVIIIGGRRGAAETTGLKGLILRPLRGEHSVVASEPLQYRRSRSLCLQGTAGQHHQQQRKQQWKQQYHQQHHQQSYQHEQQRCQPIPEPVSTRA